MDSIEKLITMAEDELTQYSTEARKIEKLRPKVGLTVPYPQQKQIKEQILADIPQNMFAKIVERDRQMVALPFWGIGGLGLLLGVAMQQPLDFMATGVGFYVAYGIQSWGWKLEAKRLVVKTLDMIEKEMQSEV
ncbi:hypothetical protein D0962_24530 [Leptolyngbyaceae cyanobacterium CCMR0082]|uniref:Uncharacterized protein n=2 Tax=Adonisia turfae TaxID=2950184 RepID=A0A6M0SBK6_9CYAN|nr:hypothetical protein [Adonisia turfae]MDV3352724.1 hypothetical protein [Leptothoe sp. LEGE 181152]NEZ57008.1 hypothetical protein [Adonisia turfae CCMR0081]NEZ65888.1 hypothetical protein [Adonisia turfae CCMR0082]